MAGRIIDYLVGMAIFTLALATVAMLSLNFLTAPSEGLERVKLLQEAQRVGNILLNYAGQPSYWEFSSPEILGLACYDRGINDTSEYELAEKKVEAMDSVGYEKVKSALAIKNEFKVELSSPWNNWHRASSRYRVAVFNGSSLAGNASARVEFPRAHAHNSSLRVTDAMGKAVAFGIAAASFYDPYGMYYKSATINFELKNRALPYFIYYSPERNFSSFTNSTIANINTSFFVAKEEKGRSYSFGKEYENKTALVSERFAVLREELNIAYIGWSRYEMALLHSLGYPYVNFNFENVSSLFNYSSSGSLFSYDALVVGTHAAKNSSIGGNLTAHSSELEQWVESGGGLILFGQDSSYGWLDNLDIKGEGDGGINQSFTDKTLRILRYPANLTSTYTGTNVSDYLSVNMGEYSHSYSPNYTYWSQIKFTDPTAYSEAYVVTSGSGMVSNDSLIVNGDFESVEAWNTSCDPDVNCDYSAGDSAPADPTGPPGHYGRVKILKTVTGWGNWSQKFYYGGQPLPEKGNLTFWYKIKDANAPGTLYAFLGLPNGTEVTLWSHPYTSEEDFWSSVSVDLSGHMGTLGNYTIKLAVKGSGPNFEVRWDYAILNVSYYPSIWIAGKRGEGRVTASGDEPHYTGHRKMLDNMLGFALPEERRKHLYKLRVKVYGELLE